MYVCKIKYLCLKQNELIFIYEKFLQMRLGSFNSHYFVIVYFSITLNKYIDVHKHTHTFTTA